MKHLTFILFWIQTTLTEFFNKFPSRAKDIFFGKERKRHFLERRCNKASYKDRYGRYWNVYTGYIKHDRTRLKWLMWLERDAYIMTMHTSEYVNGVEEPKLVTLDTNRFSEIVPTIEAWIAVEEYKATLRLREEIGGYRPYGEMS